MPDPFANVGVNITSPAGRAVAVTPSDSADLATSCRALYIGGSGNVALITVGQDTVTFTNLPSGALLPVRTSRVLATGTTATSIVAVW